MELADFSCAKETSDYFYKTEQETFGTFKNREIKVEVDVHPVPKNLEYNPEHIYDEVARSFSE